MTELYRVAGGQPNPHLDHRRRLDHRRVGGSGPLAARGGVQDQHELVSCVEVFERRPCQYPRPAALHEGFRPGEVPAVSMRTLPGAAKLLDPRRRLLGQARLDLRHKRQPPPRRGAACAFLISKQEDVTRALRRATHPGLRFRLRLKRDEPRSIAEGGPPPIPVCSGPAPHGFASRRSAHGSQLRLHSDPDLEPPRLQGLRPEIR